MTRAFDQLKGTTSVGLLSRLHSLCPPLLLAWYRIKVTLTRNNVEDGSKVPPVYAPKYPVFADEGWWVLVGDINRKTIFSFERIADTGRVVSKEVRVRGTAVHGSTVLVIDP